MLEETVAGPEITADFSHVANQTARDDWTASSQWASRPDEERFTSLDAMLDMMESRQSRSEATILPLRMIEPALRGDGELGLAVNGQMMTPTNYSFNQYCASIGVPSQFIASTLSDEPELAVRVLQHALRAAENPDKKVQAFYSGTNLRGITGENYGRIWDTEVVRAVKRVTEDSGVRWEVPTAFRVPGASRYEVVEVTKADTTLYAGDRDHFGFLVDQNNPIEVGKLPNGEPDLYFRGFYWWNGECGGVANGISTFLYHWVCANRSIRNQKGFERISIIHRAGAAEAFVKRLIPALKGFVNGSASGIIDGMKAAKRVRIARDDDERMGLLTHDINLGVEQARRVMQLSIDEAGRPIETKYDLVEALTAFARTIRYTSERIDLERRAGKIMDAVLA